jgi:hypothetical protein
LHDENKYLKQKEIERRMEREERKREHDTKNEGVLHFLIFQHIHVFMTYSMHVINVFMSMIIFIF